MITESTEKVYVRVDVATRKIVALSDTALKAYSGKPVFEVASNLSKIAYYIVITDSTAQYGFTVRAATAAEVEIIDKQNTARAAIAIENNKKRQIIAINELYYNRFYNRFLNRAFLSVTEIDNAASYEGTDENMINNIKPLAVKIKTAFSEWRFNICQAEIDKFNNGEKISMTNVRYLSTLEDTLDAFLTTRGFDTTIYCR